MEKVKVVHKTLKNMTTNTRFGELKIDENGIVEVEKDIAKQLCDILIFGGMFSYYQEPKAKKEIPVKVEPKVEAKKEEPIEEIPTKKEEIKVTSIKGKSRKS